MSTTDCFSCAEEAHLSSERPESSIWQSDEWRVAHATGSALLGWLVVLPRRHVESVDQLNPTEAEELGPLLQRVSSGLVDVLGCAKTYVVMFAEAPGYNHVHFHVVPRNVDLPKELRGVRIFDYMKRPQSEWVTLEAQRQLARHLRGTTR